MSPEAKSRILLLEILALKGEFKMKYELTKGELENETYCAF